MLTSSLATSVLALALATIAPPRLSTDEFISVPRKGLETSSETIATLRGGHKVQAIRATVHGVPLSHPIAKALIDPSGQVLLRYDVSPVPVSDRAGMAVPRLSADEALARVSAQGTFGSQGPASIRDRLVSARRLGSSVRVRLKAEILSQRARLNHTRYETAL